MKGESFPTNDEIISEIKKSKEQNNVTNELKHIFWAISRNEVEKRHIPRISNDEYETITELCVLKCQEFYRQFNEEYLSCAIIYFSTIVKSKIAFESYKILKQYI